MWELYYDLLQHQRYRARLWESRGSNVTGILAKLFELILTFF